MAIRVREGLNLPVRDSIGNKLPIHEVPRLLRRGTDATRKLHLRDIGRNLPKHLAIEGPTAGTFLVIAAAMLNKEFKLSDTLSSIRNQKVSGSLFTAGSVFSGGTAILLSHMLRSQQPDGVLNPIRTGMIDISGLALIGIGITKGRLTGYHEHPGRVFFLGMPAALTVEGVELVAAHLPREGAFAITAGLLTEIFVIDSAIRKKIPASREIPILLTLGISGAVVAFRVLYGNGTDTPIQSQDVKV